MNTKTTLSALFMLILLFPAAAQDTATYKLRLTAPLVDALENFKLPHNYPSMGQALSYSLDFYELSYWGIDELGNKLFNDPYGDKFSNNTFKYIIGLAFAKYGSELPVPLGVWAHEEYHRAVLGVSDISSENGNWLFTRWDGTVFGVSDEDLTAMKANDLNSLLYAYTSGIQYEVDLNRKITISDFFTRRTHYKNALLLYNAWYVYDYFNFSASEKSDSVKVIAPENESRNPLERDFAGADLTAWVYDMFNPELPFTSRDAFPGGEGVNRRVGFSDLSDEARDYLEKQRNLSLLNFVNPAIFFINRINLGNDFSFNIFTQYAPTHFGNDVALYLPFKYKRNDFLVNFHRYANFDKAGLGLGLGVYNLNLTPDLQSDVEVNLWNQPESFRSSEKVTGGFLNFETRYSFNDKFAAFVAVSGKTKGWIIGEPDLESSYSLQAGINFHLKERKNL
jgi:hypothetical protein